MGTIVVSGLARSGTSMMMRAIDAAGVPAFHDDFRRADRRNPAGYFEHSAVFTGKPWDAEGMCVKVLAPHLPAMPPGEYRVVFMRRDLDAVRKSMGTPMTAGELRAERTAAECCVAGRGDCDVLYADYDDVVGVGGMDAVAEFLGLDVDRMLSIVGDV